MDVLGIGFGTSNTVAVLAGPGRPPRVLGIDGSSWMPSCVHIYDDGALAVGRDAELPIVAFIGATKGACADDTVNYWKSAPAATITG